MATQNLKFIRKNFICFQGLARIQGCSGQTLVEAMLAVAVIALSVVGSISLLSRLSQNAVLAQNQFIAANLAQEGIEFIQNIRTTNWVENQDWLTNLPTVSYSTYCIDSTYTQPVCSGSPAVCTSPLKLVASASVCPLFLNSSKYVLGAGAPTPFSRLVALTKGTDNDNQTYLYVRSTVTWGNGHSITAEDRLYDWK